MNYKEVSLVSPAVHEISGFLDQMTVALLAEKLDKICTQTGSLVVQTSIIARELAQFSRRANLATLAIPSGSP